MKKNKILASLSYGRIFKTPLISLLWILIVLAIIILPLTIFVAIDSNYYEVLIVLILPIICVPICIYALKIYMQIKKEVNCWLRDSIALDGWMSEIDSINDNLIGVKKYKVKVEFKFNGKKIVQVSGEKNDIKRSIFYINPGFDSIYKNYLNSKVKILYSPMYEQILLIKDR